MSVFNFNDSREFLNEFIQALPKRGRGEASKIAAELKVSSTLVSQILALEKSFTPEQAQQLIAYLGLTGLEADYFTALVYFERAGSQKLRSYWKGKLDHLREQALRMSNRVEVDRKLSEQEKAVFYSDPLYSAIRIFSSVGSEGQTLEAIAERFRLSRARAATYVEFLVRANLCVQRGDRILIGAQKTHLDQTSPFLLRHQVDWRLRAVRRRENLRDQELMYTSVVSLSAEDFARLREEMAEFIGAFLKRVHASPAEDVACFNMDFFWVES